MIRQTVRPAESEDEGDDSLSPGVRSLNQLNNYLVARHLELGIREQKIPNQKNNDAGNLVFGTPIPGTIETSLQSLLDTHIAAG